jgi:predicted flavoprotein YhiN
MKPDVIVIGAGAAGIFAAWRAASLGAKVVLLEKTARIGTKILISGGGKCNICHDGPIESVLAPFRQNEARFIRASVYRFPSSSIIPLFTDRGIEVYTRPDGRIFPVDQTAKDVVAVLKQLLDEVGVEVFLNSPVEELICENGHVTGVRIGESVRTVRRATSEKSQYGAKALLSDALAISDDDRSINVSELYAPKVVVCAGGSSYPNSGTTGDGWKWLRNLGHSIIKNRAALAPIYLAEPRVDLSGVALRDVLLKARSGKEIARWTGDMLFTHQGISGPCALGISRLVAEALESGPVRVEVDLAPNLKEEGLSQRFFLENPKTTISKFLQEFLPDSLIVPFTKDCRVDPTAPFGQIDKKSRNRLVTQVKGWIIGEVRTVPLEKGEVVAGGVALDEVDPKTMESKLIPGLYLCGEVLDIAGPVGGYNLQAAFATGYVAGDSAAT